MNEDLEPVDHSSPEGKAAHIFLKTIRDSISAIMEELHDSGAIPEGKYFRATFGFSCGFEGHIDFVVKSRGDCKSPTLPIEELGPDRLN